MMLMGQMPVSATGPIVVPVRPCMVELGDFILICHFSSASLISNRKECKITTMHVKNPVAMQYKQCGKLVNGVAKSCTTPFK